MTTIGGDSFNKTTYPSLSDWSVNLFLKWSRQDPVSQKEIDRNNAIYGRQKNRNPFIDHPELAEYIWGNKMGTNWTLNNITEPTITSPVSGSTVDFGSVTYQQNTTKTIQVLGSALTGDLTLTLNGTDASYFSIPTTVVSQVNAQIGYNLVITYNAPVTGTHNAVLTISGGGAPDVIVNLTGKAVNCQNLNFTAPFSSSMSPFTQYSVSGDQSWIWKSAAYGVAMTGYVNSANNANEDWLISPSLNLSTYSDVLLAFDHTINKGVVENMQTENTVWVSNDYTGANPASSTWTKLTIPTYPAGNNWTFVNSGTISIPADKCQSTTFIGFKYISTTSGSSTWEIKNFAVTATCTATDVKNVTEFKHKVYCENKNINISNLENEDIMVYDIYGKQIFAQKNSIGKITVNIPTSGVYIVKAGKEIQKALVK